MYIIRNKIKIDFFSFLKSYGQFREFFFLLLVTYGGGKGIKPLFSAQRSYTF